MRQHSPGSLRNFIERVTQPAAIKQPDLDTRCSVMRRSIAEGGP